MRSDEPIGDHGISQTQAALGAGDDGLCELLGAEEAAREHEVSEEFFAVRGVSLNEFSSMEGERLGARPIGDMKRGVLAGGDEFVDESGQDESVTRPLPPRLQVGEPVQGAGGPFGVEELTQGSWLFAADLDELIRSNRPSAK